MFLLDRCKDYMSDNLVSTADNLSYRTKRLLFILCIYSYSHSQICIKFKKVSTYTLTKKTMLLQLIVRLFKDH